MALVGIELETLVSESDALTTRPPPCAKLTQFKKFSEFTSTCCPLVERINSNF